jgi:hypothetical protein
MNTVLFLLFHTMMRVWNTLTFFTTNLSVEYSRSSEFLQGVFEVKGVKDSLQYKYTGDEKKNLRFSSPVPSVLRPLSGSIEQGASAP